MENPIKMDDLGVPLFLETSISFPNELDQFLPPTLPANVVTTRMTVAWESQRRKPPTHFIGLFWWEILGVDLNDGPKNDVFVGLKSIHHLPVAFMRNRVNITSKVGATQFTPLFWW